MRRFAQSYAIPSAAVISTLMLLALPTAAWSTPIEDFAGTLAESDNYKYDAGGIPTMGTTDFNRGEWDKTDPLNTAEHELLHVIGFTLQSKLFKDAVNASNEIKVGGTVYGIIDGTSHLDPSKSVTINGTTYDQSKDLMQPNKVPNERIGPQDQMILNALYNYSGTGGILVTVNFTGPAFNATDQQAINDAVAAVNFLFPAGRAPHKVTWDAQNAVCADPPSDELSLDVCSSAVPEPGSLTLALSGLAIAAFARFGLRGFGRRNAT
jgi:hypothetical protein